MIPLTGWLRQDSGIAGMVAINILRTGYDVVREAVAGLMDEVIDPELTSAISRLVADSATGAIEIHAIRPRTDGTPFSSRCISWCLARCPYPTLTGSVIASRCRLREHFGRTVVNIHIEPEEKAKGDDAITPSPLPPQVYGEPSPQHASRPCS
ncbi:cation diffusion facilitator family transporter [Gluconacetobacter tumulicola]|nr:hypothetical protein [Gluconacetobacter tumulicola]